MALMCGSRAHAQEANPQDLERAVLLFEESERAYNEGRFDEAVAILRRAHSLHPDPTLLFNLARALEGLGNLDEAIDTYERYVEEAPDAPDRGAIEARVRTLRAQRDRIHAAGDEPEGDEEGPADATPEVVEPTESDRPLNPAPWLVAGGGAVVVGLGVVFGAVSQDKARAARDEPVQMTASDLHSEATTFATLANVFIIVGGVAVAAGVTWGLVSLGAGDEDGEPGVEAALVPGGVLLRGRF